MHEDVVLQKLPTSRVSMVNKIVVPLINCNSPASVKNDRKIKFNKMAPKKFQELVTQLAFLVTHSHTFAYTYIRSYFTTLTIFIIFILAYTNNKETPLARHNRPPDILLCIIFLQPILEQVFFKDYIHIPVQHDKIVLYDVILYWRCYKYFILPLGGLCTRESKFYSKEQPWKRTKKKCQLPTKNAWTAVLCVADTCWMFIVYIYRYGIHRKLLDCVLAQHDIRSDKT